MYLLISELLSTSLFRSELYLFPILWYSLLQNHPCIRISMRSQSREHGGHTIIRLRIPIRWQECLSIFCRVRRGVIVLKNHTTSLLKQDYKIYFQTIPAQIITTPGTKTVVTLLAFSNSTFLPSVRPVLSCSCFISEYYHLHDCLHMLLRPLQQQFLVLRRQRMSFFMRNAFPDVSQQPAYRWFCRFGQT